MVNEPLTIALTVTKDAGELTFDFAGSSPPCMGPMNSVQATTYSAVYLAMRHIFPDVPISAGAFEPLEVTGIEGTFLDAQYPRPVSRLRRRGQPAHRRSGLCGPGAEGISGIRITSAPPAMPAPSASQPARWPMISTTMMR